MVRTYQVGLLAGCLIHLVSGLNATTIVEIQQDLASESPILLGQPVTVEGIVTASAAADNLGTVFIQEAGAEAWAGIRLSSGTGIFDLMVGDRVRVSGTVAERSGMTEIESISEVEILGKGTILPTQVDPQLFTSWSPDVNEKYESMLIELVPPDGEPLQVVQMNADNNSNFGEWRLGSNPESPEEGCRVLTGRSGISSLNVSYINAQFWATSSGTLRVDPIVVQEGDIFTAAQGILVYGFSNMKLLPRTNEDLSKTIPLTLWDADPQQTRLSIGWESRNGLFYSVEASENLLVWTIWLQGIESDGVETLLLDETYPQDMRFFRVLQE